MIYQALEPDGLSSLIGIHPCEGRECPVAQNIHLVLQEPYRKIEDAIRETMEGITLESMIEDFHQKLAEKNREIKKPAHLWTFSQKSRYAGFFLIFAS